MSKRYVKEALKDSILAEYERLEKMQLVVLQGMVRRIDDPDFGDIKHSRPDLIHAIMEYRFGEGYEKAFVS